MRGATVAGMILVNNPGSWGHIHPQLRHAEWHGWTLADLVFPFFLVIVGVAIALSLGRATASDRSRSGQLRRVFKRTLRLLLFGLLLSAWSGSTLADIRIPGVLQRIAICYLGGSLVYLYAGRALRRGLLVALLLGYWALLTLVPVPGVGPADIDQKDVNITAWLDRTLLGGHLWSQSRTWDPEGILSTCSALASVLLGIEIGELLRRKRRPSPAVVRELVVSGVATAAIGWTWSLVFPINKPLWTGSYVLWTGGLAMILLAALIWTIDLRGWRRWAHPFEVFGRNAITVFIMSGLLARTFSRIAVTTSDGSTSFRSYYYERLFTSWLSADVASLAHAVAWVFFCYLVVWVMYKRGVFLRI